jgi:hypothetical protein
VTYWHPTQLPLGRGNRRPLSTEKAGGQRTIPLFIRLLTGYVILRRSGAVRRDAPNPKGPEYRKTDNILYFVV